MNGDSNLVATLVDRLTTWLPHRTGSQSFDHTHDEVVILTRTTILKIGTSAIGIVVERLLRLLDELAKPYNGIDTHPAHVFCSEVYVLELLAECLTAHWDSANASQISEPTLREDGSGSDEPEDSRDRFSSPTQQTFGRAPGRKVLPRHARLEALGDDHVRRLMEIIKLFTNPFHESYVLPAEKILDDVIVGEPTWDDLPRPQTNGSSVTGVSTDTPSLLQEHGEVIEAYIRSIVEYISFANWPRMHETIKDALRGLKARPPAANALPPNRVADDDRGALITVRLISYLWADGRTLTYIMQELCSSFLHLRKAFQTTIAIAVPLLITRWIERHPKEFTDMHVSHKRIYGGADTLFDMTNSMVEGGKRKDLLYPFQTSLLFLIPDVFEIASHMRDVKSTSLSRKASFLEMLRKAVKNRNETAIFCLTCLLRMARHFKVDSEAAMLSFALDVRDEVREAVFRRQIPGMDNSPMPSTLMCAVIVNLAHLNLDIVVDNLASFCLASNAPQDFKVALLMACTHLAGQPNTDDYNALFSKAAEFMRRVMKTTLANTRDIQLDCSQSPSIIVQILKFVNAAPMVLFLGIPSDAPQLHYDTQELSAYFLAQISSKDENLRLMAHRVSRKLLEQTSSIFWGKHSIGAISPDLSRIYFWRTTSNVLLTVCSNIIEKYDVDRSTLHFIHRYLESRLLLLSTIKPLTVFDEDFPERVASSTRMEMSLLIALCSTDVSVCQSVTTCISSFYEEARLISAVNESRTSSLTILQNLNVWKDLASKGFRFTGIVAFQKRARGLLRQMHHPTAGILAAWEVAFASWTQSSQQILHSFDTMEEKSIAEWRNYSGLLASLGGACVSSQALAIDNPGLANLGWIDRATTGSFPESLLSRYLKTSVQLLACANVRVREATREVLGSETSQTLLIPLLETLESELDFFFSNTIGDAALPLDEPRTVFAEQSVALLKSVIARLGGPAEIGSGLSVDIGGLTLNFAQCLSKAPDGLNTMRVKIKVCQLCEAMTNKKELLNLRHDVRIRNQLLGVFFGWIVRPSSPKIGANALVSEGHMEEMLLLQKDLDKSCLQALANLTYKLPLQPSEGQTDVDTGDFKFEMFGTYFDGFVSLLNYKSMDIGRGKVRLASAAGDEHTSTPELAISALSNLLSANIDVGLKHSLGIGYHGELDIRTAFIKVLCNILVQGTEFNKFSDSAVNKRYDELLKLLIDDLPLTISICDACPSSEVDEMSISLLNIFDSRGLGFVLVEALIDNEVDKTENEAELLRRNCVATKVLSIYAKWKGAVYLKATLQKVLERLISSSEDLDLELDPSRSASKGELEKHALHLRVVTKVFIDNICNSAPNIPVSFRRICSIISSAVTRRFPEANLIAVGAFIFLRFFCPAIVAPEAEGLITMTPSKEMRRSLLLIAKVVQTLANNVLFGAKEPYMWPLNEFLAQHIYPVATFLREISAPLNVPEPIAEAESFDFGSCVALHRFLYDHWDHLRQKLLFKECSYAFISPLDITKGHVPVMEAIRKLITKLGPPPVDVSWIRPAVSQNSPPSYSRFQHFMMRNAGRSTESIVSGRAVYDGGESKDGMSMICIILRIIDPEVMDYNLLLYVYLKVASRMWHKPFCIFVDATLYSGQNEPQDTLFHKLDSLTPRELSKNLSRLYVYNMNSAFRKCFRRILRLSSQSESSAFHPRNLDYHLLGNLQDLQAHFQLTQLHLPKETISVVKDTRYLFQPVTRLSKTKSKIEVIVKIGGQFVQVTTAKKQEVVQGLRLHATVNDIFRLSEVDEAPTSIQTEDDCAFGLRTESGKVVMYFTSPKKIDILYALRTAKATYSQEQKTLTSIETPVRPQDVPGTLLNIAFMNMASINPILRLAAYNLLCSLCRAFKLAADSRFMSTKELCVPFNPSGFIVDISQQLARSEPQLAGDFLNEFFVGWNSFPYQQRPLSLSYMAPWLPSLRISLITNDMDSDKAREKVASIFRKLIEVAISDIALGTILEQSIWSVIRRDELYVEILLDEVVKTAFGFATNDQRTELLGSVITSIGTITIRGKLLSKLRKTLNRTSLRPTRYLPDNTVWHELCVLLRLCLCISFDSAVHSRLYAPEVFHLVTMLANTGAVEVRLMVHQLLINTMHAMCTSFPLEKARLVRLKAILAEISEAVGDRLFNSASSLPSVQDSGVAAATEAMAILLSEVTVVAAPTIDLSNAWRSRWMSLIASTAFQSNRAIQPRAFTVMGCLASEDVDDDLLYQVLVALKHSVSRYAEDKENEMLIAIVSSLTKMVNKLPLASRYGLQLFWLAHSLVRLVPMGLFNCTTLFLDAALNNITTSGDFTSGRLVSTLLQGRLPVEDAALQLDDLYGVHFNVENFHYAIAATLVKGLTDSVNRPVALRMISTFLTAATSNLPAGHKFPGDALYLPYLGLLMSRAMTPEEARNYLWLANITIPEGSNMNVDDSQGMIQFDTVKDKELLLMAAICMIDFRYLDDTVQICELRWLNRIAVQRPSIVLHLFGPVMTMLNDVLMTGQNAATLAAAHTLLRTLNNNPKISSVIDTTEMLEDVLESVGFGGLWRSGSFHVRHEQERHCTVMTCRLIELIIA